MTEKIIKIKTGLITQAVSELCRKANLYMTDDTYYSLSRAYTKESSPKARLILKQILKNARLAASVERPLCQDTGMVVVFAEIGQNVHLTGGNFEEAIHHGVSNCYTKNFFRKSVINKPLYIRENTKSNTPAVIHTNIVPGNKIKLTVAIKGGGSENMSFLKMLQPSVTDDEIVNYILGCIQEAGSKPCPPIRLGIGVGGNFEHVAYLAKKALLEPVEPIEKIRIKAKNDKVANLQCQIYDKLNKLGIGPAGIGGDTTVFGVNILTAPTHLAAMPIAVNINCHSSRHAEVEISENGIYYHYDCFEYDFYSDFKDDISPESIQVSDVDKLRSLKAGDEALLEGVIYTARDAAHKELIDCIQNKKILPFDVKDKILFYVGPCPAREDEVIGPAGPTTSSRMDKFTPALHDLGLFGSIGKGERSPEVVESIKKNKGVYFATPGGIAVLLAQSIKKAEIIAFPGLGPEAVYRLEIEKFPVIVAIDSEGNTI